MNKAVSVVFLAAGAFLLACGVNASNSVASGVSRAFTGAPTDKAVWLVVAGAAAAIIGLFGFLRGPDGN